MFEKPYIMMIRFGDNDFGNTFIQTLKLFRDLFEFSAIPKEFWHNKAEIVKLLNVITPACQRALDLIRDGEINERSATYVEVGKEEILIGQEVYDFLVSRNYDGNSAWFVLDMSLPRDQQIAIY